ncbi:MAG: RNA methyltransferase [Candidatus Saliniplasma sp.]
MAEYEIILIEPKTPGNIGAIARLMVNFDVQKLSILNPPDIDDEALARAMHAKHILNDFDVIDSLSDKLKTFDLVVGTTGITSEKEKEFLRKAESPEEFAENTYGYPGRIALLFGREDKGLSNEELSYCDKLINIPSSDHYPILNLSHAVGIILYEIFKKQDVKIKTHEISGKEIDERERERLLTLFSTILEQINYPPHKRRKTEVMFRKLLGRATTRRSEYHRLMGVFSWISKRLNGKK